ncbi:MAG: hypothetical protein KIT84_39675 [Labilithrix sp.]|nr:hypothetical protein [Labilithrix sp.]MCW5817184.1 hypothetical protein [Labilithrix sp.]
MSEPETESETESESESVDAIALFRPRNKAMILPFLDLDDGDNDEGIYAEELPDGSFLLHTFQPYALFAENPTEARTWLAQFGVALPEVHDDPRGFLFFPDDAEPDEPQTYDDVVRAAADDGMWIALGDVIADDEEEEDDFMEPGGQAALDLQQLMGMMGGGAIDPTLLEKLAGQLQGGAGPLGAAGSFEIGQMFEQMQRGLLEAMTPPTTAQKGAIVDDEFEEEPDDDQ